jgi:hypothetical protein
MNLIKIVNPNKAKELMNLGFTYTKEKLEDKDIYVFIQSDEIYKYLKNNFSKQDYFIDKRMNFV